MTRPAIPRTRIPIRRAPIHLHAPRHSPLIRQRVKPLRAVAVPQHHPTRTPAGHRQVQLRPHQPTVRHLTPTRTDHPEHAHAATAARPAALSLTACGCFAATAL